MCFHKRRSFEHEKEYRAVILRWKKKGNGEIDFSKSSFQEGIYVSIELDKLVENVYLSPTCPTWQKDVAQSLLKNMVWIEKLSSPSSRIKINTKVLLTLTNLLPCKKTNISTATT